MPLTPQDVHEKVFGPTRFRRGYDEAEVDGFLDEVEAELIRLHREIEAARAQGVDGNGTAAGPDSGGVPEPNALPFTTALPVTAADAVPGEPPSSASAGAAQAAAESVTLGGGSGDLEQRVARTLVLAQRAADDAVRDAEQQAEQLRTAARTEAERLRAAAQTEADRIRSEAEQQVEGERRELEGTRTQIQDDVEQLRAFEREYRTRLRAYLELQLRDLDEGAAQVEAGQTYGPDRTRSSASAGSGPAVTEGARSDNGRLLTSELPADDPAGVPAVPAPSEHPSMPPSVAVPDYEAPAGVSEDSDGDELRREPRGLHDGL